MPRLRRSAIVAITLLLSAGCDQVTKLWAIKALPPPVSHSFWGDFFRLQYAENRGAFLSLGARLPDGFRTTLLTVAVGALLFGLLFYVLKVRVMTTAHTVGYSLILGGGLSNWVDRVLRDGFVVDFMNMGIGRLRTGIFNVADVLIFAGVGVLMVWRIPVEPAASEPPAPSAG